jgi:glutamine cyclotransferase
MKQVRTIFLFTLNTATIFFISLTGCKNNDSTGTRDGHDSSLVKTEPPAILSYSIISPAYPHDTASFTQGLTFYKGELYEGTGYNGKSKLMKVDLKTGKAIKSISLDNKYFGEGIAILRDTIYQLTWQQNVVFVYAIKGNDFKKVKEFPLNTEGWGITTDGKSLIVSTGGNNLDYYDPSTFTKQKSLPITDAGADSYNLNELEYIDGYIYANQWQASYIFKIDPATGKIVAKANLAKEEDAAKAIYPKADVLNGIAYDETTKKIYVTGKYWPALYEIQFSK